ncbi:MAG: hypothetical protein V3S09_06725, partial [Candidatus Bathyarchaeia archaeon]
MFSLLYDYSFHEHVIDALRVRLRNSTSSLRTFRFGRSIGTISVNPSSLRTPRLSMKATIAGNVEVFCAVSLQGQEAAVPDVLDLEQRVGAESTREVKGLRLLGKTCGMIRVS